MNKENSDRRREDDRRGGGRGYNDRGYDNRDNRDNRNNNRDRRDNRDNRDRDGGKNFGGKEQRYQKKNTQGDDRMDKQNSSKSTRGGKREDRERPPREIVEITNEDMGKQLKKNFEAFVSTEKYNKHLKTLRKKKKP